MRLVSAKQPVINRRDNKDKEKKAPQYTLSLYVICKNTRQSTHDLFTLLYLVDIKKKEVINNNVFSHW